MCVYQNKPKLGMALAIRELNTSKSRAVSNNINLKCLMSLLRVSRNYAIIRQQVDNDSGR